MFYMHVSFSIVIKWRSEDNLWAAALSFYHLGHGLESLMSPTELLTSLSPVTLSADVVEPHFHPSKDTHSWCSNFLFSFLSPLHIFKAHALKCT